MNWDTSIENFKNYLKLERGLSMNSIESYEFDLIQFKNFMIENAINESPKQCSSSTVKTYLYKNFSNKKSRSQARSISALKSFFNYLLFEGEINSSPLNDIESPKIENKLPEVLTEDEIKRLISSVNLDSEFGQRNKTIIEVLYGTGIRVSELTDLKLSNIFFDENIFYVISNLNKLGTIHLNFKLMNWKNTFEIESDLDLINSLSPDQSKVSVNWKKNFKNLNMYFDFDNSLKNSYKSNNIELGIEGNFLKNFKFAVSGSQFERSPNFNFILFRSQYDSYNWYNPNMSDEKTSKVSLDISYKNYVNLSGEYNIIDNFTFFRESVNPLLGELDFSRRAIPNQSINEIKYYKVKLYSNIPIGKFSIINTAQYQKKDQVVELEELSAVNVPEWVTRNTIMYSSKLFNNSLYIQTGVTFNYFTKFWANYYNPLISEFVVQNYKEIGEFPRFDLFFNAKIQQTRVFIKVEHLNSSFSGYDYYSDPFTPYRDMSVRFGLVWNFFQ